MGVAIINHRMQRIFFFLLAGILLSACTNQVFTPTFLPTLPAGTLTPYQTSTSTATALPRTATPLAAEPTLSPTPFIHVVQAGEVFSAIAARYGLTVEELKAANPNVILSPFLAGQELVIPGQGFTSTPAPPTPTPLPVDAGQPVCLAEASSGAWCFVLVHNPLESSLENVSAVLELYSPSGETLPTVTANGLLNLLPGGATLPLAIYVPAAPAGLQARVTALHALPVPEGDPRYLPARLEGLNIQVASDGLSAAVQGQIVLEGETPAAQTWAALTAFDVAGNVVGVRRWESPAVIQPGQPGVLDGRVFSMGGRIERVEVLLEARP